MCQNDWDSYCIIRHSESCGVQSSAYGATIELDPQRHSAQIGLLRAHPKPIFLSHGPIISKETSSYRGISGANIGAIHNSIIFAVRPVTMKLYYARN
jgi:hypothetical protein